jgi:uncharacterized protein DUF1707
MGRAFPTLDPMSSSPDGADESSQPHIRIGNDERAAATQALDEHLSAGRLEPDEYGDRVAAASVARTREELEALFVDLPEPHPRWGAQLAATDRAPAPRPRPPEPSDAGRDEGVLGGRTGSVVVALAPIIALALFFATRWWVWFLLVPAVAVVVCGGRDRRRHGR